MAVVIWIDWQDEHITRRHEVSAEEFEQAWEDRIDEEWKDHTEHGPYCVSVGFTDGGKPLRMVWRYQDQQWQEVWPITAFFLKEG